MKIVRHLRRLEDGSFGIASDRRISYQPTTFVSKLCRKGSVPMLRLFIDIKEENAANDLLCAVVHSTRAPSTYLKVLSILLRRNVFSHARLASS